MLLDQSCCIFIQTRFDVLIWIISNIDWKASVRNFRTVSIVHDPHIKNVQTYRRWKPKSRHVICYPWTTNDSNRKLVDYMNPRIDDFQNKNGFRFGKPFRAENHIIISPFLLPPISNRIHGSSTNIVLHMPKRNHVLTVRHRSEICKTSNDKVRMPSGWKGWFLLSYRYWTYNFFHQ